MRKLRVRKFKKQKIYVTLYEVTRVYGGPEEGGWYYTVLEALEFKEVATREEAIRVQIEKGKDVGTDYYVTIETNKTLGKQDNTQKPAPRYC